MKIGGTDISSIKIGSTAITKVMKGDSLYWGNIPESGDALFWLDGTIIEISGSKYFKDQTHNSRNFLITDYDFDATWTLGFPYKSASTISAPAGDATLIAEDINNYLYDSGGTPNQIPVISLFQDVDYEHKLFTRHAAQVLDANNVETYEPRVLDVVLYNTVKTATALTNCQTYYSVPTEDLTAKWVSKTGNDTTGDGTKTLPWLTLAKAESTAEAGSVVYIKSGLYVENDGATTNFRCLTAKSWESLGCVEVRGTAGTSAMLIGGSVVTTWKRIIFNVNGLINAITGAGTLTGAKTFTKCKFTGTTQNVANSSVIYINGGIENIYSNCIFNGVVAASSCGQLLSKSVFTMSGCYVGGSSYFGLLHNTGSLTGTTTITYNKFVVTLTSLYQSIYFLVANTNPVIIKYNYFNDIGSIRMQNQSDVTVQYNRINQINSSTLAAIEISKTSTAMTTCNVSFNKIKSYKVNNYIIKIGTEVTSVDNNLIEPVIEKNEIQGAWFLTSPTSVGSIHTIFVGYNINPIIRFNKFIGCGIGIVLKHTSGTYVNDKISHNLFIDCPISILLKGIINPKVYNNTFYNSIVNGTAIKTEYLNPTYICSGVTIKNNIIFNNLVTEGYLINIINGDEVGLLSNNNVIYSTRNNIIYYQNTIYTLSQWITAGFDSNSQSINPNLENYIPILGSVAIGNGEDLGTLYDDGLDASTDWGSDTEVPTVVTKQQGASWDIGAYIH